MDRLSLAIRLLSMLWLRDLSLQLPRLAESLRRPRSSGLDSRCLLLVFLSRSRSRSLDRECLLPTGEPEEYEYSDALSLYLLFLGLDPRGDGDVLSGDLSLLPLVSYLRRGFGDSECELLVDIVDTELEESEERDLARFLE